MRCWVPYCLTFAHLTLFIFSLTIAIINLKIESNFIKEEISDSKKIIENKIDSLTLQEVNIPVIEEIARHKKKVGLLKRKHIISIIAILVSFESFLSVLESIHGIITCSTR
jgi:hypothetical protein